MLPSCLRLAREAMAASDVTSFSFDIFDTFLLRRCTGPDGVYERTFHLAPIPPENSGMLESFVHNRMIAESNARKARIKREQKGEVTIEEIYRFFPFHVFGLTPDACLPLAEAEFQAELDLCLLNREIWKLYQEARSQGLKTGFLSDTYWSREQLHRLLTNVAPDLEYDFLYPSSQYGVGKSSGLFKHYLEGVGVEVSQALHIGDNPRADIEAARALGIRSVYYPQISGSLDMILRREMGIRQMIQSQRQNTDKRLDSGLMVMRRVVTARRSTETDISEFIGTAVLGPVLTGFQYYIEKRIDEIRSVGGKVAVAFLARDGHLPMKIWQMSGAGKASYVEINSRVTMLSGGESLEVFKEFFRPFSRVNAEGMQAFFKADIPKVRRFFEERPDGFATGEMFAEAIPELLDEEQMKEASRQMRERFIAYFLHAVPDFKDCTDLVIVDIGYRGTIQFTLRETLDKAGFADKRLHGVYLATVDNKFIQLPDGDTGYGFLDGSTLTPSALGILLRNITVMEQCFCAPVGSVSDYNGFEVIRESDSRSKEQLAFFAKLQDGVATFFDEYQKASVEFGLDPLADMEVARTWAATILLRFLLRPTSEEQKAIGELKHDLNLGSDALADFINLPLIQTLMNTMTFAQLCYISQPVGWLGGSLNALSPMAANNYSMVGFGLLEVEMLSDRNLQHTMAQLIVKGKGHNVPATCMLTGFGDVRVHIPVLKKDAGSVMAIPLKGVLSHGVLRSVVLQHGENPHKALIDRMVQAIPLGSLRFLQAENHGPYFKATGTDGYLLFDIPETEYPLIIVTVIFVPLPEERLSLSSPVAGAA